MPSLKPRPPALRRSRPVARPARLSEEVSSDLNRRIARGELRPGDRLPTEKVLGETFGVSRAVVREAIARLKADGLIETRQGSGAYVAEAPSSLKLRFTPSNEAAPRDDLRQIFELRAMVEGAVAELAARRRTRGDITVMKKALAAMDSALARGEDGTASDDAFHIAIAAATRNPYVSHLVEFLGRHFSETRRLAWPDSASGDLPRAAQQEHRTLLDAIAAGDGPAARTAALSHLRGAAGRVGITLPVDLTGQE